MSGQLLTSLNRRADYYAATFLDVIILNGNYWCNNSLLNIPKNKLSSVIRSVTHFVHSSKVYQCTWKFLFLPHRFNIRFVSARFFGKLPLLFVLVSWTCGAPTVRSAVRLWQLSIKVSNLVSLIFVAVAYSISHVYFAFQAKAVQGWDHPLSKERLRAGRLFGGVVNSRRQHDQSNIPSNNNWVVTLVTHPLNSHYVHDMECKCMFF